MSRPKGIAPWNPDAASVALLKQVNSILEEYEQHLPLTARQIFYRLVGQYGYDKTEHAYSRLCEKLVRARRALLVPFASIRDDGTTVRSPAGYDDVEDFWQVIRGAGKRFRRHRQAGQPVFIELSCEASGMVPQMVQVAFPYSVPVYSGSGFNSLTAIKEVADRALGRDVPTVLLHVGDFDPSGVAIFDSLGGDAALFVSQIADMVKNPDDYSVDTQAGVDRLCPYVDVQPDAELRPVRVALTDDQVDTYELDTAPPKRTDSRSANWPYSYTAQAEALPPDTLADLVRSAIQQHLDLDVYEELVSHEDDDRRAIIERLDR